jgi:hypothetical protein
MMQSSRRTARKGAELDGRRREETGEGAPGRERAARAGGAGGGGGGVAFPSADRLGACARPRGEMTCRAAPVAELPQKRLKAVVGPAFFLNG